jgi:ASC-1-like (ASCH) protein
MNLYRRYFDLVASGRKTIEVRVPYANLKFWVMSAVY